MKKNLLSPKNAIIISGIIVLIVILWYTLLAPLFYEYKIKENYINNEKQFTTLQNYLYKINLGENFSFKINENSYNFLED